MLVYRISKKEYIDDLSGFGSSLYGGRWNPKGFPLVYTAGNIALAYVEFLVHNLHILKTMKTCMACIEITNNKGVERIDTDILPDKWQKKREYMASTQKIGERFIKDSKNYILKVPSAVVPGEYNYLLNPRHELHKLTKIIKYIDPFEFDPRLIEISP